MRRFHPDRLRAAAWALRASARARRATRAGVIDAARLPRVPPVPDDARSAVVSVLRRVRAVCLTEALVLQAWDAAHGRLRDLIVGTKGATKEFAAHAWLDGDPPHSYDGFVELVRHPALGQGEGSSSSTSTPRSR